MSQTYSSFIFILLLTAFSSCENKKEGDSKITKSPIQKIDSLVKECHKKGNFEGGVVITNYGKLLYEEYFGLADRSWNIPVAEDVKFDIASINKSMIAALILKANEVGKLDLQDKLVYILRDFSFEGVFHPNITIHHMLSHTSGLPDYGDISTELKQHGFLKFKRSRFTNEEYVNFISGIKAKGNPGKEYYYSNFAYHLLAIILEEIHQAAFEEILRKELAKPLGLKNTTSSSKNEDYIANLAKAYTYNEKEDEWLLTPFIDRSLGRRIFSTPYDLNRWAQAMYNPGYLSKQSLDLIKTNHLNTISKDLSYGYGWFVVDNNNFSKIGHLDLDLPYIIHGGSTDGYKSMLININQSEYVISFLSNVGDRTQEMTLAQKIVKLLIDKK